MDLSALTRPVTDLLDGAMDRALVLGYTRIGSGLRRRWWPADPAPDARPRPGADAAADGRAHRRPDAPDA